MRQDQSQPSGRREGRGGYLLVAALVLCLGCRPSEPPSGPVFDFSNDFSALKIERERRVVAFGSPESSSLLLRGWAQPDRQRGHGWAWAIGRRSAIRVTLLEPRDLTAVFRCWPFRFPGAPTQHLKIHVNGNEVGSIDLENSSHLYRLPIPGDRFAVGDNEISFEYSYARRPREVDPNSRDARLLAVAWESFRLEGSAVGQPHLLSDDGTTMLAMPPVKRVVYEGEVAPQGELTWEDLHAWPPGARTDGAQLEVRFQSGSVDERFTIPVEGSGNWRRLPLSNSSRSHFRISLAVTSASKTRPEAGLEVSGLRLYAKDSVGDEERKPPARASPVSFGSKEARYGVLYLDTLARMQVGLRYRVTTTIRYPQPVGADLQDVRLQYAWFFGEDETPFSAGSISVAQDLGAGETVTISSPVTAPERPGSLRLRVFLDGPPSEPSGRWMEQTVLVEPLQTGEPSPAAGHVRIVGLDGATWSLLVPWAREGKLPNLARILEQGAWGDLEAFSPTLSPVIWTSIATGKRPEKHGIEGFQTRDSGSTGFRPVRSSDRKAAPFWSVASSNGRTSTIVNWMVTAPPEPINGVMLSGLRNITDEVVHPPNLASPLSAALEEVDPTGTQQVSEQEKWLGLLRGDLRRLVAVQQDLQTRQTADVAAYYTHSTDEIQHRFWKYLEPDLFGDFCPPPTEAETQLYGNAILEHYQDVDRWLGQLLEGSGTLILVSDHGAIGDSQPRIYIQTNRLLALLGYAELAAGKLDATRSRAFDCTANPWGYELGICLNVKGREESGLVDPAAKPEALRRLQSVLAAVALSDGSRLFGSIRVSNEQGVDLQATPKLMTCEDLDRELVLSDRRVPLREVVQTHDVSGNHTRFGIVAMIGDPIRPGPIRDATVFDVAPTILYLLGLPLADDLDGKPLTDAIEEDFLLRHPVRRVSSYDQLRMPGNAEPAAPTLDESTQERLRSLGYIQ